MVAYQDYVLNCLLQSHQDSWDFWAAPPASYGTVLLSSALCLWITLALSLKSLELRLNKRPCLVLRTLHSLFCPVISSCCSLPVPYSSARKNLRVFLSNSCFLDPAHFLVYLLCPKCPLPLASSFTQPSIPNSGGILFMKS